MGKVTRITARSDGRGGAFVCKEYKDAKGVIHSAAERSREKAGEKVSIGDFHATVTSDGRINIPKRVMDKYGAIGKDGRRQVDVQFGGRGTKIGVRVSKPGIIDKVTRAMAGERKSQPSIGAGGGGAGGYGGDYEDDFDIDDIGVEDWQDMDYDDFIDMDYGDLELEPYDDGDFYFDD